MKRLKMAFISLLFCIGVLSPSFAVYAFPWGGGGSTTDDWDILADRRVPGKDKAYATRYPEKNCTEYEHAGGYFYIEVYQNSASQSNQLLARYKIKCKLGSEVGCGDNSMYQGSSYLDYQKILESGTDCIQITETPRTRLDAHVEGFTINCRQYVLEFSTSADGYPGFCTHRAEGDSNCQIGYEWLGNGIRFLIDTNGMGMTNYMSDGQFHHGVCKLYIEPREYTLNFNTNNPDGNNNISISKGSQKARYTYTWGDGGSFPTPTKPGYRFTGWYTDPNGGTQITESTQVYGQSYINEGGDTAYAHWTQDTYTCYFNGNGGTVTAGSRQVIYNTGNWNMGASSAYRTGYTFLGYYTDPAGGIQVYDASGNAVNSSGYWSGSGGSAVWKRMGDATLYAHWTPNQYTMTFHLTPNPDSEFYRGCTPNNDFHLERNSQTSYYDSPWGTLPSPTKPGYIFKGWYSESFGSVTPFLEEIKGTDICYGNVGAYAWWTPKKYTLRFDSNNPNGTNDISLQRTSQTVGYTSRWGTMPTCSKPGYRFLGWFTAKTGGNQITANTVCFGYEVINNNGAVAYAHWEPIEYTVQFHGNQDYAGVDPSVTGSMADIKIRYDQEKALPLNTYAKETSVPAEDDGGANVRIASVFQGWSGDPASLTPAYADGANVKNLTTSDGSTIHLYAVWDDAPAFVVARYPDRYFTLEEAQSGAITEEELLKTVEVYDRESRSLPKRTGGGSGEGITVVGYDASEFTSLTDDGAVLVRYRVEDASGTYCFLNIYAFVSRNGAFEAGNVKYLRGISDTYKDAGKENGGLRDGSVWKGVGASALNGALSGGSKAYDIRVDKDTLKGIRGYVESKGFGNSQNGNALSEFWDSVGIVK